MHIRERQAQNADRINATILSGGTVRFLDYPYGDWKRVARAWACEAQVMLLFKDATERMIGTENNDSYTLEYRNGP